MGLSWQQGPLAPGATGRFLVPDPLPERLLYADPLRRRRRVAFAWRAMDAFYEEDERIVGHAADSYHRIDIRQASRHLVVRHGDRVIADSGRPLVLYESGFAPRWYLPGGDVDQAALAPAE